MLVAEIWDIKLSQKDNKRLAKKAEQVEAHYALRKYEEALSVLDPYKQESIISFAVPSDTTSYPPEAVEAFWSAVKYLEQYDRKTSEYVARQWWNGRVWMLYI